MAVVGWINPDLLEIKFQDCVCALCLGVMVEPTSGCPEGHSFCKPCYAKAMDKKRECPTCRRKVDQEKLVRMRPLENIIAELPMRCEWGDKIEEGELMDGSAAKRAKLAPASSMAVDALRKQLGERGLDSTGDKPELVAHLEEDRKKNAVCRWKGSVGELLVHRGECAWEPVKCPHKGCTKSPLRRDRLEHQATCEHRVVECGHCEQEMTFRSFAGHEGIYRAECEHEEVTCPCPGCDKRLLRKNLIQHVGNRHKQEARELLVSAWSQIAVLEGKDAASESEQRLAAASTTSWVFNWRAEGWGNGAFTSETHDFGDGVTGSCSLRASAYPACSHFIGYTIEGRDKCRVHATFFILDNHDKILRQVHEMGTAAAPDEFDFTAPTYWGQTFTPTAADKARSVRADGSIRLRAEVRLFLD
jgi:hypothetical protein